MSKRYFKALTSNLIIELNDERVEDVQDAKNKTIRKCYAKETIESFLTNGFYEVDGSDPKTAKKIKVGDVVVKTTSEDKNTVKAPAAKKGKKSLGL